MALQKNISLQNGIDMTSAYIIIGEIEVNNKQKTVKIKTVIYKDVIAYNDDKPEVVEFIHTVTTKDFDIYFNDTVLKELNKSIYSQSYLYLKTLSLYSDASDV